ncbi:MAG TPA: SDR family oxidoreductase [Acidimicrobiia bacterium]|nr:SDR family oxidoreductase [Acidimicrobiia bacterium]
MLDAGFDPTAAFRLDGKVALLTGASSGLGSRFAEVLAAAGAMVVATARRADRLDALAARLAGVEGVPCDVADAAQRSTLVRGIVERHGRIDVLVNNAGTTRVVPALEESDDDFEAVLTVNLVAPFSLARDAATVMAHQSEGGSIVNVASVLGMVGVGQIPQAGYAASKGGLVNLTRELAAQWARKGVRVNALAPGWFPSEMTGDMFDDERSMRWVGSRDPMGRGGEPHELDGALLFLASPASSYVTGQVLAVDGGWTAV